MASAIHSFGLFGTCSCCATDGSVVLMICSGGLSVGLLGRSCDLGALALTPAPLPSAASTSTVEKIGEAGSVFAGVLSIPARCIDVVNLRSVSREAEAEEQSRVLREKTYQHTVKGG